jgi:hypothetical protein
VAFTGTAVVTAAILIVIGWQAHWPGAVFGTSRSQVAQLGAGTRIGSASVGASQAPSSLAASATSAAPAASLAATSPAVTQPSGPPPSSPPPASTVPASTPPAGPATGPAATVEAYFAAITAQDYATAWRLGGRNTGTSYADYVAGFNGTATDTVTIVSVTGDVVTARLVADQADGTVKTFGGSYTVAGGVIIQFSVRQIS